MKTYAILLFGLAMSLPFSADLSQASELQLIDSYKIRDKSSGFSEPSGLSLSSVQDHYWVVSDAEAALKAAAARARKAVNNMTNTAKALAGAAVMINILTTLVGII